MASNDHVPARFFGREADATFVYNRGESKEGQLKYWKQGPLWITQIRGWGCAEAATEIARNALEIATTHGQIVAMHDWYEMTMTEKASREILTDVSNKIRGMGLHKEALVCTNSIVVKMSLIAANIILGNWFEVFMNYEEFVSRVEELRVKYGQ